MSKLPVVSGKDTLKAFQKIGYQLDHQTGSHMILRCETLPHRRLTIPNHKELAKGTLSTIIMQAGKYISREDLEKYLLK